MSQLTACHYSLCITTALLLTIHVANDNVIPSPGQHDASGRGCRARLQWSDGREEEVGCKHPIFYAEQVGSTRGRQYTRQAVHKAGSTRGRQYTRHALHALVSFSRGKIRSQQLSPAGASILLNVKATRRCTELQAGRSR